MHPREYTWHDAMDPLARLYQAKFKIDSDISEACRAIELIVATHGADLFEPETLTQEVLEKIALQFFRTEIPAIKEIAKRAAQVADEEYVEPDIDMDALREQVRDLVGSAAEFVRNRKDLDANMLRLISR